MDQQQNPAPGGVPGPTGRRLHIAHRRSPSEMTPLVSMFANGAQTNMNPAILQQQIEALQQQQQQLQQFASLNGGMLPNQPLGVAPAFPMQPGINMSPQAGFQFPPQIPQQQPQQNINMGMPPQTHSHRRNQSALPGMGMGPPPAPSSGASGSTFGNFESPAHAREGGGPSSRGGRGGGGAGGGHQRRHSLVVADARKAAEIAQQKRTTSAFQFPAPGAAGSASSPSTEKAESDVVVDSQSNPAPAPPMASRGRGGAHGRSQSMAVGRGGSSLRGGMGNYQADSLSGTHDFQRRGGGSHARTNSRNFDSNWRNQSPAGQGQDGSNGGSQQQSQQSSQQQQPQQPQQPQQGFQPGHRSRASVGGGQSISQINAFPQQLMQLQGGAPMMVPGFLPGQQFNALQMSQMQALQQQMFNLQNNQNQQAVQGQGQGNQTQQRKTLFTPYLPQATLPPLFTNGSLVQGILRVNKKNRSDAYVTTVDGLLDADIFICGSKDRNRALEGDLVAVELLDVDEVWSQKREKEEKKKRKDITGSSNGTDGNNNSGLNNGGGSLNNGSAGNNNGGEGGIRRRGSLRQRPTQKKNDDVEVEGQSLLLVEEEEINDEQKPLFAGHIVAVVERMAGQMFSGTLGLLRPSSQATKDKQDADRNNGRNDNRNQDRPKIVWFKPTDKRVPLIAIPTEQAPRDFVERHQDYADRIFVACIKRWPITSLHPFGTLAEVLGKMGDVKAETDALLRDNNFPSDDFSEAVLRSINNDWGESGAIKEDEADIKSRRDFRDEKTFTIDLDGSANLGNAVHVKTDKDGNIEIGVHVPHVAHFVKLNSLVEREAKKRGTSVYLLNRTCALLPPRLATDLCSLVPDEDRLTVSVVFKIDAKSAEVEDIWTGKSIIKSNGKLSLSSINEALTKGDNFKHDAATAKDLRILQVVTNKFRETRLGNTGEPISPLRLIQQLDDENIPIEHNIFDTTDAVELVEELMHKVNAHVAQQISKGLPTKAILRRHAAPNSRRLQTIADRLTALGYDIDTTSSSTLQTSLFKVDDSDLRKGMETSLVKSMQRAKYFVTGDKPQQTWQHYGLNLPVYTHFTAPTRRVVDIMVQRQLEAVLSDSTDSYEEDANILKTMDVVNVKKDSAQNAQEQSVHIESCRIMDKKRLETPGDLIAEGIVLCVYESAFDVLIPEWGFEKRVHCDQLPLKKAEFRKDKRVLELYWEKGVTSSSYVPEDERVKSGPSTRMKNAATAQQQHEEAERQRREREEAARKQIDTGTISTDDADALFDDDDDNDDNNSDITEAMAGASLAERPTQSVPGSPSRLDADAALQRARSDAHPHAGTSEAETRIADKDKYLKMFKLREEDGEYIQDVTEMTRVPIILKTDLSKSPPCLTIRSVNPYAL